jgi:glyceraldehyde 3-phosphate dehydrogenase
MEPLRIGLIGLGRVGRNLFRLLHGRSDARLVAVADATDGAQLEYLLRFDTLLGRFPHPLAVGDGWIVAEDQRTPLVAHAAPGEIDWAALGVEVVIDASDTPRTRAELEAHLLRGARRIVLCTPPKDAPDATVVMGINEDRLGAGDRIVSNASCTAHAAAPVLQVLDKAFGIERALLTTIHAYSNEQRLADVPAEDMRRGRAAAENIIPQATHAAEVLGDLLPALAGKLTAMALNVPVANGSAVDLVCWHTRDVTPEAVREALRAATAGELVHVLAYEDQPIVSSDILRSPYSGTFDADATMTVGTRVSKTLTWFDNSWAYSLRAIELAARLASLDRGSAVEIAR